MVKFRAVAIKVLLASAAIGGMAASASAAPIVSGSTINFAGQSSCTATACTFGNAIVTSGTGSFSAFTFGTAATFSTLTYSPFTAQQVYTVTSGSQTASFATTSQLSQSSSTVGGLTSYTITDAGISQLTGFDATPGVFTFTANQNGTVLGSFSATEAVAAVPELATWAMMMVGIGATGATLRRRRVKVSARVAFA